MEIEGGKMRMKIDFKAKKGFICDMDGVLYHGNRILPGAAEFVQWLQRENKEYLFLTNNQRSGYRRLFEGPGSRLLGLCHRRGGAAERPV